LVTTYDIQKKGNLPVDLHAVACACVHRSKPKKLRSARANVPARSCGRTSFRNAILEFTDVISHQGNGCLDVSRPAMDDEFAMMVVPAGQAMAIIEQVDNQARLCQGRV
jgi:hypothetical protein